MSTQSQPPWIDAAVRRPRCIVPWVGYVPILSSGAVFYCCESPAVVGNVNETPFEEIWNNATMQRIRATLSNGELPPECRTPDCPIHRGDEIDWLLDRIQGANRAAKAGTDPHRTIRERLDGGISIDDRCGRPCFVLSLRLQGEPVAADLFVHLRCDGEAAFFAPERTPFPTPWGRISAVASMRFELWTPAPPMRDVTITAALFAAASDPNLATNCYWLTSHRWTAVQ